MPLRYLHSYFQFFSPLFYKQSIKYKDFHDNENIRTTGYHWLKNEPTNYRGSCIFANRATGEGGKGCFFPLKDGSPCLTDGGTEIEIPLLLDPCKKEDVELISFMGNNVECSTNNEFDKERVEVTRVIYNLIDGGIKRGLTSVWNEVDKTLSEYESSEISEGACIRRLKELVSRENRYSACAISAVKSLAPEDIQAQLDLEL